MVWNQAILSLSGMEIVGLWFRIISQDTAAEKWSDTGQAYKGLSSKPPSYKSIEQLCQDSKNNCSTTSHHLHKSLNL